MSDVSVSLPARQGVAKAYAAATIREPDSAYAAHRAVHPGDADQCENDAAQGICQSYASATDAPCAVDGSVPDLAACFDDATIADPLSRERDFITRLATFFCGPDPQSGDDTVECDDVRKSGDR